MAHQAAVGAQMVVRAPPGTAYFSGAIEGSPGSTVLLAIREDRAMHGTAFQGAKTWALGVSKAAPGPQAAAAGGSGGAGGALTSRLVGPGETSGKGTFECGYDPGNLEELAQRLGGSTAANASVASAASIAKVGTALRAGLRGWCAEEWPGPLAAAPHRTNSQLPPRRSFAARQRRRHGRNRYLRYVRRGSKFIPAQ